MNKTALLAGLLLAIAAFVGAPTAAAHGGTECTATGSVLGQVGCAAGDALHGYCDGGGPGCEIIE